MCGKELQQWTAISNLADIEVPFPFVHGGFKFTLKKKIVDGEETEDLLLYINDIEFETHPFLSKDFVLESELRIFCSNITLNNDFVVFEDQESETWSEAMLVRRILN